MTRYLATVNMPGYLTEDDEPALFDTARDAWEYLADDRKRWEDDMADDDFEGYSAAANLMESISNGSLHPIEAGLDDDRTGSIATTTPGYTGNHDIGRIYSVTAVND